MLRKPKIHKNVNEVKERERERALVSKFDRMIPFLSQATKVIG